MLSGTVTAYVIRADGATVPVLGSLSGNTCSVILSSACYEVEGTLSIAIKLAGGGSTTTLCAVVAYVYKSITDTAVDPSSIIPSVQALIEAIENAVDSIPSDYSDTQTAIKETWRVFGENNLNVDLAKASGRSRDFNNVVFSAKDGVVTVNGTSSGATLFDLFSFLDDPASFPLLAGKTYALSFEQSDSVRLYTQIQYTIAGSDDWVSIYSSTKTADVLTFTMPNAFEKFGIPGRADHDLARERYAA